MKLPKEIRRDLRSIAVTLPDLEDGEGAWAKNDALAVLHSLRGTTVAVSDVVVFEAAPSGYVPSERSWQADRYQSEPDADFALRTRSGAALFMTSWEDSSGSALFVLTFPMDKDAA